jgi:hypothetical protein
MYDTKVVEPFLSLNRAALRLGVPEAWLKTEAKAGRIPCLRAGRRLLFSLSAVEAALLERAHTGEGVAYAAS